jgi:hypothetical protein
MTAVTDDGFDLYDLRVEVVAPEGATLFCGAKPGDYFELKGEMLHLPPGQAISIYDRCRFAAASGKAARNPSKRLDVDRCRNCLP